MSDSPALPTIGSYQLKDQASWPYWFVQLQFHALSKGEWDQVNPDAEPVENLALEAPKRPTFPEDKDNFKRYEAEVADYRARSSDWEAKVTRLQHVWNWVNPTVDPELLVLARHGQETDAPGTR
jgi:hypothetical protein